MKFILTILLVLFGVEYLCAAEFEQIIGGEDFDRGVYISPTRDGGFISAGVTKSFGRGDEDVYLVKTDSKGETIWTATYGGPGKDNGWSVLEIPDGFVIAGYTQSYGAGGFDFYLVKTALDGDVVWSQTYGGSSDDRCWALAPTKEGGFFLTGETASTGAGERDCFLVKSDPSGKEIWSRTYGGERDDRCFSIVGTDDGGCILTGQTYSEGAGDRDVYVLKVDATGELDWSKTFGGPASDVGHSITRIRDGSFLITGYTSSFAQSGDDPYLIKIDASGKTDWTRVLRLEGINHTLTGEQAGGGGFFLVGFSNDPAKGEMAALLVKTDEDGNLDWSRDILPTNAGESFGYTVRATPDGGCIFTGHTTVKSHGNLDMLIVKIDDR